MTSIIAFVAELRTLIPFASIGIPEAEKLLDWALDVVRTATRERRPIKPEEWQQFSGGFAEMQRRLHSDTE